MYNHTMKKYLLKLNWLLNQFGINPIQFLKSIKSLHRYFIDLYNFQKINNTKLYLKPCLTDWFEESGSINNEYFWQDLLVSQMIYEKHPSRHIDIGSRIDGFVAHVASFRKIEVFDVRPIYTIIPNVDFRQSDFMDPNFSNNNFGKCDSLSCLHTIEHFGLGRYGDPIKKDGYLIGLKNMTTLINKGGYFYFSTPIGKERVEFNANRVFNPKKISNIINNLGFEISKLLIIKNGNIIEEVKVFDDEIDLLSNEEYNLGVFIFVKL
jgi:hypothetical protein